MRMYRSKTLIAALLATLLVTSCAPQAKYFYIDSQYNSKNYIPISANEYSIYPIVGSNEDDSTYISNAAIGMAEKIEKDNELESGTINVFSIPSSEFNANFNHNNSNQLEYTKSYASDLVLKTHNHNQIYISNLKFGGIAKSSLVHSDANTELKNFLVPYTIELSIYNALSDTLIHSSRREDSIYVQAICTKTDLKNPSNVINKSLPQLSKKIGEMLATSLTPQWETQKRMLITFESSDKWEKAYNLAYNFKWKEAIAIWMELSEADDVKKSAFAAYNIAVALHVTEQDELAKTWVEFGLNRYRFRELILLQKEILENK